MERTEEKIKLARELCSKFGTPAKAEFTASDIWEIAKVIEPNYDPNYHDLYANSILAKAQAILDHIKKMNGRE